MAKTVFSKDQSLLDTSLSQLEMKLKAAIMVYLNYQSNKLTSYMQINRPWRDRTGEAKRRLNVKPTSPDSETLRLVLSHGVPYGVWLEMANEKRYAIINPTIKTQGPKVVEGLQDILSKI